MTLQMVWSTALQVVLAVAILYSELGGAAVIGVALLLAGVPFQVRPGAKGSGVMCTTSTRKG